MGKYMAMLSELEAGKKSDMPMSPPDKPDFFNKSDKSGSHLRVSEIKKLVVTKPAPKPRRSTRDVNTPHVTKVYHVVLDTDGVHKGMTIIDPSGKDLEAFRRSCCNRFGEDRIISIELRQGRSK